jgi:hypothetical protein
MAESFREGNVEKETAFSQQSHGEAPFFGFSRRLGFSL